MYENSIIVKAPHAETMIRIMNISRNLLGIEDNLDTRLALIRNGESTCIRVCYKYSKLYYSNEATYLNHGNTVINEKLFLFLALNKLVNKINISYEEV